MKTIKKAFLAFVAVAIVFTAQANNNGAEVEPLVVKFRQTEKAMSFDVLINQLEANTTLRIVDRAQNTLWEDAADSALGNYGKRINVQNLVIGEYNLVISNNDKELIQPFTVTNDGVFVESAKRFTVYQPEINVKSKSLTLKMRQNRETLATISFADKNGEVFFTDTSRSASIRKKYDTSELAAGTYTMYVETAYTTYEQTFEVN